MAVVLPGSEYAIVQSPRLSSTPRWSAVAKTQELAEIRVCVNRSCGKLGSRATLEVLSGIAPQGVAVSSCGCLGRCGAGPNLFVLPGGAIFGHCSTPARAAQLLSGICGSDFDPWRNLEALSLKTMGEEELEKGNPHSAVELLTKAIELIPSGGLHMLYKTRSLARLRIGDNEGAFEDAKEACEIAPGFPQAYICKGDALLAKGDLHAAEMAYSTALSVDPSIRRSNSFKVLTNGRFNEELLSFKRCSGLHVLHDEVLWREHHRGRSRVTFKVGDLFFVQADDEMISSCGNGNSYVFDMELMPM